MRSRARKLTVAAAAGALLLSACNPDAPSGGDGADGGDGEGGDGAAAGGSLTYVIASNVIAQKEEVATFAVPQALGLFDEANLDVELVNADGSTAAIQAVASGSGDITAADLGSLYAAVETDVPVVGLGGLVVNWPWRIGVAAGSDIAGCEDLAGATIGIISLASGSNAYARSFVESCGLDPESDVELIPVGVGPQAQAAIEGGDIDALALYTQAYTALELQGLELEYLDNPAEFDELTSLTWIVSRDALENRPEVIASFLREAYAGLLFSNADPRAAMELAYDELPQLTGEASAEERIDDDTDLLATWLETTALEGDPATWEDFGYLDESALSTTMDFAVSAGTVSEPFDPADAFDDSLLEQANDFDRAAILDRGEG